MIKLSPVFHNKQFQSIAFAQMLTVYSSQILLPVMPLHLKMRGFTESQIGLVMGIAAAGALVVRPWAGFSVDTKGSRTVMMWGQTLLAMCIIAYIGVVQFLPLLILRFLHGIAVALYATAAVTFAASVESPQNTSTAIAMFSMFTMMGLGAATGSSPIMFTAVGFTNLAIIGASVLLAGIAIMLLRAQPILPNIGAERVPFAVVLKNRHVLAPTICLFASNFAFSTSFTFIPLVSLAKGIGNYSLFYIAFTIAVVLARFSVQYLTRIWTAKKTSIVASMINAVSVLIIAIYPSTLTFILSGLCIGMGFGVIYPSLAVYVVNHAQPGNKGTALGILSAAGDVGTALGASVLGVVAQFYGYPAVFSAATLVVLICVYYFHKALD